MKTNSAAKNPSKPATGNLRKSCENLPPFNPGDSKDCKDSKDVKEQSKIQHLEINLNRVCLQQDALMPLLQMIEYIPAIQRTDSVVKGLLRKIEENEHRILKSEKMLESRCKGDQSDNAKEKQKLLRQVADLNNKVKDMELMMSNLQRWYEAKLKEENQALQRTLEHKIEKQQKTEKSQIEPLSKRISTETSKAHSKQPSSIQPNDQPQDQYQANVLAAVEQIVQAQISEMRNQIQAEISDLRSYAVALKQP